jgi:hypothetical protein
MDPITIVGLVGTVVQFVDFSSKIVSKSTELYRSGTDALAENADIEITTKDLLKLNTRLKQSIPVGDTGFQTLCQSCCGVGDELIAALSKVKVDGKGRKWQSLRKAIRSIWSKEDILQLEKRLASFRDELNLRITIGMR